MIGSITNFAKKATFLAIAWVVGLILMLIAFEIILRIIYYDDNLIIPRHVASELNLPVNIEYNYNIEELYPATEKIVLYKRDKFGIRNSCGDPSNIDILTIGGSTTDQRYIKNESTYQAVLENLASNYLGREICVANAGIDAYSTYGHIRSFEDWFPHIPNLKPKYVMLYVGVNDANFNRNYGHIRGADRSKRPIKTMIRRTLLAQKTRPFFQYIKSRIEGIKNANVGHRRNVDITNYEELEDAVIPLIEKNAEDFRIRLQKNLDYIADMGAIPICVTQPHAFQKQIKAEGYKMEYDYSIRQLNKVMYEVCGDDKVIDIYSVEFPDGVFYDAVHTADIGSEFLGKKMFEAMKEKNMLDLF